MISVTIRMDGQTAQFIVRGHAEFAEKGKDIVCAGISTLTNTLANVVAQWEEDGLTGLSQIYPLDEPQHIFVTTDGNRAMNSTLLAFAEQYQQFASQYPENVRIEIAE